MSRDVDTGEVVWQSESELNKQLEGRRRGSDNRFGKPCGPARGQHSRTCPGGGRECRQRVAPAGPAAVAAASPEPQVLPDADPEEQSTRAWPRHAERSGNSGGRLAEFREFNKGHPREADALFWLGRIQFLREQFDLAAMTFSEFNSAYPDDARIVDTTMWIAEAVSRFAPADQACAIYASLPNLLDSPPDRFTERLAALSQAANCGG